jgi:non-ribosomal peptide synthetase component F
MPLIVSIVLGWAVQVHVRQARQFVAANLVDEAARAIELGDSPRQVQSLLQVLAQGAGLPDAARIRVEPTSEHHAKVTIFIEDAVATARANTSAADPAFTAPSSDRGSMLPMFGILVGVLVATVMTLGNASAALIADARAQSIASTLATELASANSSEFSERVGAFSSDTGARFDWTANRIDARTTRVDVCVDYEAPLNLFATSVQLACATRSARLIETASG